MFDIENYRNFKTRYDLSVTELDEVEDYLNNPKRKLIPSLILYRALHLNMSPPLMSTLSSMPVTNLRNYERGLEKNKNHLSTAYLHARYDYPDKVDAFWKCVPPWYKEAFFEASLRDFNDFHQIFAFSEKTIREKFHYVEEIDRLFTGDHYA